jgi:hypothetical protein
MDVTVHNALGIDTEGNNMCGACAISEKEGPIIIKVRCMFRTAG